VGTLAFYLQDMCASIIERGTGLRYGYILYLLHPPTIDDLGLTSALQWLADGYVKQSGLQVSLEVSSNIGWLKPEIEMTLFRIAQESRSNTHRHAESPTAIVRLFESPDEIVLEVVDRGKGMPARAAGSERSRCVGIAGIEERVKELKGHFSLETSPNKSVTIHVTLPVT
jgi:two-component system NarL family sensor kinase